jgi:hypothetical protein
VRVGICIGDGGCASWGVFKLGLQVGVGKLGCSSLEVPVGVCRSGVVNSWFPSVDGVSLPTTSSCNVN